MIDKLSKLPAIEINRDTVKNMRDFLTAEERARVFDAVFDAFDGKERFPLETPQERIFFEEMYAYGKKRAQAWYNRHYNFFENNPKKKK